jgi:ParB/RepB/Spo0J family partition protein
MQNFCLSESILQRFKMAESELGYTEHIVKLKSDLVDAWEFRGRKVFEEGNLDDLAVSIKNGGQCQPIIVVRTSTLFRPKDDPLAQYAVIAGHRRWMACKKFNMDVLAVIRTLTFEQAVSVLVTENEREHVSDYSKGMLYANLLNSNNLTEEQLSQRLNISLPILCSYLAFAKVPENIWLAVGDMSRVSTKTADVVLAISNKGPIYVEALIKIAKKIARGYGEKRIHNEVDRIINHKAHHLPDESGINHKVIFNGKVIVNVLHGKIKLDKVLMSNPHYHDLVSQIEKDVTEFASTYLQKH